MGWHDAIPSDWIQWLWLSSNGCYGGGGEWWLCALSVYEPEAIFRARTYKVFILIPSGGDDDDGKQKDKDGKRQSPGITIRHTVINSGPILSLDP